MLQSSSYLISHDKQILLIGEVEHLLYTLLTLHLTWIEGCGAHRVYETWITVITTVIAYQANVSPQWQTYKTFNNIKRSKGNVCQS